MFIQNRKKRSFVAQLRLGILPLNIEVGRFRGVKLEERICEICKNNSIEDEFHFVCVCPAYICFRETLYNSIDYENFINMDDFDKFLYLMRNEQSKIGTFLDKAWQKRNAILYN